MTFVCKLIESVKDHIGSMWRKSVRGGEQHGIPTTYRVYIYETQHCDTYSASASEPIFFHLGLLSDTESFVQQCLVNGLLLAAVLDKRVSGGRFVTGYSVGQESVRWKVCYLLQCWTRECQVEGLLLATVLDKRVSDGGLLLAAVLDKRVSGGRFVTGYSVGQESVRWKVCY